MRRLCIIIFALLCSTTAALAQNIIIGDKIPKIRSHAWLMDAEPDSAPYTCIIFYHSESDLCNAALRGVKQLCREYKGQFNIVIITKEDYSVAGVSLTSALDNYSGVLFDNEGRIFRDFGVKFVPFCVIYNSHREAVWCGNAATLNINIFRNIVTEKDKI